ncbi:putative ribosomal protein L17 [Rosa chinensis]|uniref:Putative ribosomal protein L17 n=1 Tax=Rosa chinensis TaxID=74649 RepID=A0A2P6P4E0_ROSCH|nr:putative ribosomal protein L17 [Rosa chinensis]
MLRTMVSQFVKHECIETAVAKAKEVRHQADRVVQRGKDGSLAAARSYVENRKILLVSFKYVSTFLFVLLFDVCHRRFDLLLPYRNFTSMIVLKDV